MASVTAAVSIPVTPEKVWAVVSDVPNAGRWNRSWERIEMLTESTQGRGTRFRAHAPPEDGDEDGRAFDFEVTEWTAPEYIRFTPVREPGEGQYQVTLDYHAFRLVPVDGENTRVELTAHATSRGLRGRVVGLFFWPGHQRAGLEEALKSLAAVFGVTADDSS
jgi:uncharacterized protein YndB with AHSA1/START domain